MDQSNNQIIYDQINDINKLQCPETFNPYNCQKCKFYYKYSNYTRCLKEEVRRWALYNSIKNYISSNKSIPNSGFTEEFY